jgi:hypothetical protein
MTSKLQYRFLAVAAAFLARFEACLPESAGRHIIPCLVLASNSAVRSTVQVLGAVLLATLASKACLEGWASLPKYCPRRGRRTLACFAAGFGVFPLPELLPRHYWLFHSLWHMFMADG